MSSMLKAASILRKDFPVASADASVRENEELLRTEGYVVLTDVDPFKIVTPKSAFEWGHILLGDCIHELPCVGPETALEKILSVMNEHDTNTLPIYRENTFIGVVRRKDVSQALYDINSTLNEAVKRKTKELEKSRNHFIHLADSISAIFFAVNGELQVTYWGRTAARLSGIDRDTALGKPLEKVIPDGPPREWYERVFKGVIALKRSRRAVYNYRGELYHLVIYPFGSGVTVIATNNTEERSMLERDVEMRRNSYKEITQALHNDIGQYLSALSFRCGELNEKLLRKTSVLSDDINGIHELCIAASESLHRLIESIVWKAGEHISDSNLINHICAEIEKTYPVRIERKSSDFVLPDDNWSRRHIIRFLQEALVNAAKYSGRDAVVLTVQRETGAIRYRVSDRGKGFDYPAAGKGIGLKLMQFNADEIGGELDIESGCGGTTVMMTLPL